LPSLYLGNLIDAHASASLMQTYLEALSDLQDGLDPFDSYTAFELIERQLGRPLEEMYSHITTQPVAAASLGQVYKATLASSGDTVAVKVQRPGIGESIAIDMLLLRQLLGVVDRSQDFISQPLVPLVDEFAARLFGELDYIQEGHHCEKFAMLYSHVPRITVPGIQCAPSTCTSTVLLVTTAEAYEYNSEKRTSA
jgi:aarF domain-containing kinase